MATTAVGLYLHVPYCLRRCGYCAFNTYAVEGLDTGPRFRRFLEGARRELDRAARALGGGPPLETLYLGGGTPTVLGAEGLAELLAAVRDHLEVAAGAEVTVEANPDTVDPGLLSGLVAGGVDRISFGMQSADPAVLRVLDRRHRPERALEAVAEARRAGFRSISLDLIAGTPGEDDASWRATVEAALAADPDHLSAYSLSIEPGTRLAARVRRGELAAPDDDVQAERYRWLDRRMEAAGFAWYEISNWARGPEHRSRHNLGYWRNHHWWGLGPGAHSHLAGRRWWNERDPTVWADRLAAGHDPAAGSEVVAGPAVRTEQLLLGIRLADGVAADALAPEAVDVLVRRGLLRRWDDRVALTLDGRLLADQVVLELL